MFLLPFTGAALISLAAYDYLNFLQLNNYRIIKSLKNFLKKRYAEAVFMFLLFASALFVCLFFQNNLYAVLVFAVCASAAVAVIRRGNKKRLVNAKNPLVFTKRVKRQYIFITAFNLVIFSAAYMLFDIRTYLFFAYAAAALYAVDLSVSVAIINAFEKMNNKRLAAAAAKKLASYKTLVKIGVTGSYGKTSVKNILYAMLKRKYAVAATEKSYNTPMGIAKSIGNIDENTQIFIAEMGARKKGEIKELCDIVKPDCGVITGVAEQHLETFKSLENIIAAKSELFFAISGREDGFCVFNYDDKNIRRMKIARARNAVIAGTRIADGLVAADGIPERSGGAKTRDNSDCGNSREDGETNKERKVAIRLANCYARGVSANENGVAFELIFVCKNAGCGQAVESGEAFSKYIRAAGNGKNPKFKDAKDGRTAASAEISSEFKGTEDRRAAESVAISSKLIGEANATNIAVAAAAAYCLGVSAEDIKIAAEELEPVPHRMQVIKSGGLTVIDDAYNSNPIGAAAALETLASFKGRKIAVACGFAEQGKNTAAANAGLGRQIAAAADVAALVGAGAKHILKGLKESGFPEENIFLYPSLNEAKKDFSRIFEDGDVILFENDMPDNLE